jgi:Lrp/AsnC family transcriptional regulator, leucine-responsive regulatory protein
MTPLDAIDVQILQVLQADAGLSNQDLADRVGLSPSPCSRRVRALEQAGTIERRVALLDRKKLGLSFTALVLISMDRHTPERLAGFEAAIARYPEVQACYLITGQDADYVIMVCVPDLDHYQEFLLNKLTHIEGVSGVRSSFVMRRVIETTALPLAYLQI